AAAAVASPTANTLSARSGERAANAATALALVKASALTPVRSRLASVMARTSRSGSTIGSMQSARTRAAVASAVGCARVIQSVRGRRRGLAVRVRVVCLPANSCLPLEAERRASFGAHRIAEPNAERARLSLAVRAADIRLAGLTEAPRPVRRQGLDDQT